MLLCLGPACCPGEIGSANPGTNPLSVAADRLSTALEARFGLDPELLDRLRRGNILYDRDQAGEFFQFYSRMYGEGSSSRLWSAGTAMAAMAVPTPRSVANPLESGEGGGAGRKPVAKNGRCRSR